MLVPAMGVVLWIALELASEEFIYPLAILVPFVVLVTFIVVVKTIRFEAVVLCLLLMGYLVGNRGFANLALVKPLFPGEIGMVVISVCVLSRFAVTRELPDFSGWIARVIFLYCILGGVRLALDYKTYGMDAIRDSAVVYYSIYYFFGRQLLLNAESERLLENSLKFSFVAMFPISVVERLLPDLLLENNQFGLLFQKDDLLTSFAAVAVYMLYTRPGMFRFRWIRPALILYYIAFIISGVGRAAVLALVVTCPLVLLAGRTRFLLYPVAAMILGLAAAGGFMTFGNAVGISPARFEEKVSSMVDITGTESSYAESDYGVNKAATNDFRRKLWSTFIDYTNSSSPLFGRGFGYDFVVHFEEEYGLGEYEGLRSAHNFYVTLYGRMGWAGICVFAVLTLQIIVGGIRAALAVKANRLPISVLGYWCAVWVILLASTVGVVLEGPIGAVIFWSFLGVAVETSQRALRPNLGVTEAEIDLLEKLETCRRLFLATS